LSVRTASRGHRATARSTGAALPLAPALGAGPLAAAGGARGGVKRRRGLAHEFDLRRARDALQSARAREAQGGRRWRRDLAGGNYVTDNIYLQKKKKPDLTRPRIFTYSPRYFAKIPLVWFGWLVPPATAIAAATMDILGAGIIRSSRNHSVVPSAMLLTSDRKGHEAGAQFVVVALRTSGASEG
jgi:hypothetical protein